MRVLITSHCNLKCKHCYQHFEKNKYMLSSKKLWEIVDFAISHGVDLLDFSGGEFFTHPEAYNLLDYCCTKHIKTNIATNATLLDVDFFSDYKDLDLISFQFSVDGLRDTHDERRGCGTFDKMMKNAHQLKDMGYNITASMALDSLNYQDAIEVLKLSAFSDFYFLPVAFTGAATLNSSGQLTDDYETTICYLLRETDCSLGKPYSLFPNTVTVNYDGGVYPNSEAADYRLFCMGNINEDDLSSILISFLNSEDFNKLSSIDIDSIPECNDCISKDICSRGSQMRAYKFFKEFNRPDPVFCRVFIDSYKDIPFNKLFWGIKE